MNAGPLRVLLVTQYFWPERFAINAVVERLVSGGAQVDVVTGLPNYPDGRYFDGYDLRGPYRDEMGGAAIFRVPLISRGTDSRLRLALNYLSFVAAATVLAPLRLRKRRYDVIFVYLPSPILTAIPAMVLGRIKDAGVVLWVQDLWPGSIDVIGGSGGKPLRALLRGLVRWIYRRADRVLVSSAGFVEPVLEILGPDSSRECGKVDYLPNTFDSQALAGDIAQECPLPVIEAEFAVVLTGNLGRAQAIPTILDAAELLRAHSGVQIYLVGAGSMVNYIREQILARGLDNVALCGQYPLAAMPGIFSRASALLVTLSAVRVFENTVPSKVQAYMSAGKPIIASANGETAHLVTEAGAGIACPAEDPAALAESILNLARQPKAELVEMGRNGKDYFHQHFDPAIISDKLLRILCGEVAGKTGPAATRIAP